MEKAKIQQLLDAQPDDLDVDAFIERLYLLEKIEVAEAELAAGQGMPHDIVLQRIASAYEDLAAIQEGLKDLKANRVRPFADVALELRSRFNVDE